LLQDQLPAGYLPSAGLDDVELPHLPTQAAPRTLGHHPQTTITRQEKGQR